MKPKAEWAIDLEAMKARGIITSAEREVKDSRGLGMYQSWLFWEDWARKVCRFSVLFGYLTEVRAELVRDI